MSSYKSMCKISMLDLRSVPGLTVLQQDLLETIIGFICSQNNNVRPNSAWKPDVFHRFPSVVIHFETLLAEVSHRAVDGPAQSALRPQALLPGTRCRCYRPTTWISNTALKALQSAKLWCFKALLGPLRIFDAENSPFRMTIDIEERQALLLIWPSLRSSTEDARSSPSPTLKAWPRPRSGRWERWAWATERPTCWRLARCWRMARCWSGSRRASGGRLSPVSYYILLYYISEHIHIWSYMSHICISLRNIFETS